jgi:hypothetical protein
MAASRQQAAAGMSSYSQHKCSTLCTLGRRELGVDAPALQEHAWRHAQGLFFKR